MTGRVFADTAGWLGVLDVADSLHRMAVARMAELARRDARLVTTEFVLLEVADALCSPAQRGRAVAFLDDLRNDRFVTIVPVSSEWLAEGWSLYRQRPDKGWSLTDCISFAVMTREGITDALTSDHHFEQAGFRALLA